MKTHKIRNSGIAVLFVALIAAAVTVSESRTDRQILMSGVISPHRGDVTEKKIISGNLSPIREIEVKSAIPGILETYYVQIGDKIGKGDRIAKIKILSEPSQIENAKMNLKTAQIVYEKNRLDYERDRNLYEKGVITATEYEESAKNHAVGKEQYEYAKNQLHLLVEGYIPSSDISNVVIATADGTVTDLPPEEGTPVVERNNFRDGTTIALIARLDSFLFKGKVIESDVLALKKGMKLTVMPSSMEGFTAEATVRKISPRGYPEQGIMKYDIEASFTLPDSVMIYSGFNASAEFVMNERKDVLLLPESCLRFRNDSVFVEVVRDGKPETIQIETGVSDDLNIEIVGGISENDRVRK
ncbi:MAG: efflux RND transporter periplasmic adaptor subunit [Tannerella sp.]|jgi:HlyD family secretion protein|nr:efflux RND transporter periplasmic adaptor subunit [Tannerella sp.]